MMSSDHFDDPFRDALAHWEGPTVDPTAAHDTYDALRPGFQRARARRRARFAGAATMAVVLAVGTPIALAQLSSPTASPLDTASAPELARPDIGDPAGVAAPDESSDDSSGPTDATPPPTNDSDVVTTNDEPNPVDEASAVSAIDEQTASNSSEAPGSGTPTPDPEPAPTPPAVDPTFLFVRTDGGSVLAQIVDGAVVIDEVLAAQGYLVEKIDVDENGLQAEVDFGYDAVEGEPAPDDIEVQIRLVDGELVSTISTSPHDDDHNDDHDDDAAESDPSSDS